MLTPNEVLTNSIGISPGGVCQPMFVHFVFYFVCSFSTFSKLKRNGHIIFLVSTFKINTDSFVIKKHSKLFVQIHYTHLQMQGHFICENKIKQSCSHFTSLCFGSVTSDLMKDQMKIILNKYLVTFYLYISLNHSQVSMHQQKIVLLFWNSERTKQNENLLQLSGLKIFQQLWIILSSRIFNLCANIQHTIYIGINVCIHQRVQNSTYWVDKNLWV